MKAFFVATMSTAVLFSSGLLAQSDSDTPQPRSHPHPMGSKNIFIDVHHLGAGKVTAKELAGAHEKDLAVQGKYGVRILKYWFDEKEGNVYCFATAPSPDALRKTHTEAHGLEPAQIYPVVAGKAEAKLKEGGDLYLDIHQLGAGNVSMKDVAAAHQKDLAVQKKYGVNILNYWVDEKDGTVICLSQAPNADAILKTHKEAHGLMPVSVEKVSQGE